MTSRTVIQPCEKARAYFTNFSRGYFCLHVFDHFWYWSNVQRHARWSAWQLPLRAVKCNRLARPVNTAVLRLSRFWAEFVAEWRILAMCCQAWNCPDHAAESLASRRLAECHNISQRFSIQIQACFYPFFRVIMSFEILLFHVVSAEKLCFFFCAATLSFSPVSLSSTPQPKDAWRTQHVKPGRSWSKMVEALSASFLLKSSDPGVGENYLV